MTKNDTQPVMAGNRWFNNPGKGFSLLEMAVVLLILGLLFGLVSPLVFKVIKQDKVSAAKAGLEDLKKRVIGYAIASNTGNKHLPLSTDPDFQINDPWGNAVTYLPAPDLTAGDLCNATGPPVNGLGLITTRGEALQDVAFILVSPGMDHAEDTTYSLQSNCTDLMDDLVVHVSFYQLYRLVCGDIAKGPDSFPAMAGVEGRACCPLTPNSLISNH